MCFLKTLIMIRQPAFQSFFGSLLAVSRKGFGPDARRIAESRSRLALDNQFLTNSCLASLIKEFAVFQNLCFERGVDMAVPLDFGGSFDEHVHGYKQASQTVLRSNGPLDWMLLAVSDDD
jgi:hypothetical protein